MNPKDLKNLNIEKETAIKLDRISNTAMSIALSSTTIPIIAILNLEPINQAIGIGASMLILSPINYTLLKKVQAKVANSIDKDIHHANQVMLMMLESREKDREIGELTSCFLPEIEEAEEIAGITLPIETLSNINQFLYLINANYYNSIAQNLPSLDRELLMENIAFLTLEYLRVQGKSTFSNKDTKEILDKCYYIKPATKKEIIKEFKAAKTKYGNKVIYQVIRKDMDIDQNIDVYLDKKEQEMATKPKYFDVESLKDYERLLKIIRDSDLYDKYGDISEVTWDLDFLRQIMVYISKKYRKELKRTHPDYCNFKLVASFMHNATIYALVNKKDEVGQDEMIQTFKAWTYLEYQSKVEVLDDIFNEFDLDYEKSPYHKTHKTKKKILPFISKKDKKEDLL